MATDQILIVFNSHAGGGRAKNYLALIKAYLKAQSISHEFINTTHPGHAQSLVAGTDLTAYAGVVAAGGDGTLFEVINGLMSHAPDHRPPLGIIPVGTGNAFARELDLQPTDWKAGIDIILKQRIKSIDLGHVKTTEQTFYFINIIGMGFVVDAGCSTLKIKKLGQSAYTLATLWQTIKLKKHPIQLTLTLNNGETEIIDEKLVFVEVANSRYTGTSFLIAPEAEVDDGLLDVIILKKISRLKILKLFPTIYSGKHVNYKEVESRQVKSIAITTQQPMPLMPDGEFIGNSPATIRCIEKALKIFS